MILNSVELEGLAVTRLNGYRTRRPKQRPKKSKGHGIKSKWRDRLKDKVPPWQPAVRAVKIPDFLSKMLALRPEARCRITNETLKNFGKRVIF